MIDGRNRHSTNNYRKQGNADPSHHAKESPSRLPNRRITGLLLRIRLDGNRIRSPGFPHATNLSDSPPASVFATGVSGYMTRMIDPFALAHSIPLPSDTGPDPVPPNPVPEPIPPAPGPVPPTPPPVPPTPPPPNPYPPDPIPQISDLGICGAQGDRQPQA